jgi:hypothetical protein
LFGIVEVMTIQSVFCLEMHQNYFLKIITSAYQNNLKTLKNFILKKIKIFGNAICIAFSNTPNAVPHR